MRKALCITVFMFAWNAVAVWADGEQRHMEKGTTWVDPVEFYHLQDINRGDLTRDYDQGDIDFNKVLKKRGVKVYGLRLKPFAGAFYVLKYASKISPPGSVAQFEYQDLYGIKGTPIHEAGFCVYFDESVSRSYTFSNNNSLTYPDGKVAESDEQLTVDINSLRLVQTDAGIGFSYAMHGHVNGNTLVTTSRGGRWNEPSNYSFDKPDGVRESWAHFIYFKGARDLLVMLSAPHPGHVTANTDEKRAMANSPWGRVYFIVDQMLVDASAAAAEEAAITGKDQGEVESPEGLTNEDKTELLEYMEDLVAWLGGEGDPFGFGERTDEKTAAVINTIATVSSILLGTGLAGVLGGTGASIAGGMTEAILSGTGGGVPPTMPETPQIDGLEPKRPEEEEEDKDNTPPPPEEKLDFFDKYTRTDADGDIYVKDPVTGKETLYINNGDGTYRNFNTGQNWAPDEINENLRYRDENSGPLKQDAETAAKNAAEQHAQWEKESTQISKEGQEYLKWKHEHEAVEKKQDLIEKLAVKYHVPPTEKAVTNAIKWEKIMNQLDAKIAMDEAKVLDKKVTYLEIVEKVSDVSVNILGSCIPGGEAVKNAYTFAKAPLVAWREAVVDGKSGSETALHVIVGMGNGALGVIQNQAGDLAGNGKYAWVKELGLNVLTEDIKEGMNAIAEGKSAEEIGRIMISTTGSKAAEFGVGKLIGSGMGWLKGTATKSLNPKSLKPDEFHFNEKTAKVLDKWLNKTHTYHAGKRTEVFKIIKVSDTGKVSWGGFSQGFSKFYGKIDTGKAIEAGIGEIYSNAIGSDWGGSLATGISNWGATKAGEAAYGLGKVAQAWGGNDFASAAGDWQKRVDEVQKFTKDMTKFNNMAADFRKR